LSFDALQLCLAAGALLIGATSFGWVVWLVLDHQRRHARLTRTRALELGVELRSPSLRTLLPKVSDPLFASLRRLLPPLFTWRDGRRLDRHAAACAHDLPDMIDIMILGLQAGLSFDGALSAYVGHFDTPVAREFALAQHRYQLGLSSRRKAFQELCERAPDEAVMRFCAVVSEALLLGAPLSVTFSTLSFELRRYQKLKFEERIARAPVKLLIPLGLCVLPAVLILLMGPVLIQMIAGLRL